ncbi:DJ-1/PfpI family protein [Pararhodospirillum oryzae]|uniref:Glutamine amidotransferase n=1 Tax=Pararhodospirillum oryzae TaxID=478448 RepID=A0A512H6V8_9PROT|nr:DJ-1/PfpI family protein [Pararhodospirillum oryzae]GEO81187.1 glutamine amidotransferase [Pararhodospirillum oryzae]
MIPREQHLEIGSLVFEGLDQIDLTGPYEVLARVSNATYRLYGKTTDPVRDITGLRLIPDATLAEAPALDVLHVPGGFGQEALMDDEEVLEWIRRQAAGALVVFTVCTGALICGAAGLLQGRRSTTHWAALPLLPYFGATPVNERVVVDGAWISAAGVTAGIDGALRLVAALRGDTEAKALQLFLVYAPEPPFDCGSPETAPPEILAKAQGVFAAITAKREATAKRVAARLGISV